MERILPKKLTESGRIRIGDQEPNSSGKGTHPHKLETFRLTSQNKPLLHFAANLYGGEVRSWVGDRSPDGHFELYTTVNSLDVLVPTVTALSVQYETWSGSGCTRRCDGQFITHCPLQEALIGMECQCPEDEQERAEQAKDGKACARIARFNVILPDLPGLGLWRMDTKGYYATAELLGALELFAMMPQQIIEASLRLEQRVVKRFVTGPDGKKTGKSTALKFAVPILWPKFTPRQMLAAADQRLLLMTPPPSSALQLTAGKAADDLFGDGAGARLMNGQGKPNPVHEDKDKEARDAELLKIDTALRDYGLSEEALADFWEKQCVRFQLGSRDAFRPITLPTILHEVQERIAKNPKVAPESTTKPEPETADVQPLDGEEEDAIPQFETEVAHE